MIGRRGLVGLAGAAAASPWIRPRRAKAAGGTVVFAGYGGTIEQFLRDKLIPDFQKATGIKIEFVVGTALSNYARVIASRNNPEIDVYWSNELTHAAGKQQGLYTKLDTAVLTNLPDIIPIARDADDVGVASYLLACGIEYNTKGLADAGIPRPQSWQDLWDPRLKGRVAMYTFDVAYSQDILAILTRLAGGTEADVRPGVAKIKSLRSMGNLTRFAQTPAELDNMLVQGQAWMTVNGSARAGILKSQGAPIDFCYPTEGAGFFTNYFDPVKNSPNPAGAQIFINYLISPETQLLIAKGTVTAPVNRKVVVPPELEAEVPHGETVSKMIRIDRATMNRDLDKWAALWNQQVQTNG